MKSELPKEVTVKMCPNCGVLSVHRRNPCCDYENQGGCTCNPRKLITREAAVYVLKEKLN